MTVSFTLEGGLPLMLARTVSVAALLSTFGTLVFQNYVVPRIHDRMAAEITVRIDHNLRLLTRVSITTASLATFAWLVLQAADMADASSVAEIATAVPVVARGTAFGHLIIIQLAVLLTLAAVAGRPRAALVPATLATALQAGHSHAASMYSGPSLLLACDVFHLWGAGGWLGGLLPLLLVVREAPPKAGAIAARWFSPLGQVCIVVLTLSALFQGWVLVASIAGLVGTAYGWMVLVKLALFGVLLAFALANRYRFAPALLRGNPLTAKRVLVRSVAVQTGFGVAIIVAATVLSSLPPAMHLQPLWPFPLQFSLVTVSEDADFRMEAIEAALALAGAAALLVVAMLSPGKFRWPTAAAAVAIACFALPHLDLLLVQAYPTSFYLSPTGFSVTTIAAGSELFPQHCAVCHGEDGSGDGPAAKSLPIPPADLTAAHLWMHEDGELFWWLSHGIAGPDGHTVMPGFAGVLSDDQRWDLIDYIRAHNAGVTTGRTGNWSPPLKAPDLQAVCDGRTVMLHDLRGRFVRLVIGVVPPASSPSDIVTVTTGASDCAANEEQVPLAYATISGIPALSLAGTQFLIDRDGWLRALQRPDAPGSWNDLHALAAAIGDIRAHPIIASGRPGDHMDMRM